ncbi:MAG: transcription elongation factor [Candidatus Odinarchaeia archaeon]
MGRRKTKKVTVRPKPRLPTVFSCPACGKKAVRVEISRVNKIAKVKCGNCGLEKEFEAHPLMDAVDAYGEFVDAYASSE